MQTPWQKRVRVLWELFFEGVIPFKRAALRGPTLPSALLSQYYYLGRWDLSVRFLGNANITNCGVNGGELGGALVSVRLTVEREEKKWRRNPNTYCLLPLSKSANYTSLNGSPFLNTCLMSVYLRVQAYGSCLVLLLSQHFPVFSHCAPQVLMGRLSGRGSSSTVWGRRHGWIHALESQALCIVCTA